MIEAIVTDIEGTTSALSFVKSVLFPYAEARLPSFVRDPQHPEAVAQLKTETEQILQRSLSVEDWIACCLAWSREDKKIGPLKKLQGLIWKSGYENGDFKGHVYPDVAPVLNVWKSAGLRLYIYSSGSVDAQQLLFSHSDEGDLTPLFSGYFDTDVGGKRASESYTRIAELIGLLPKKILFLSDVEEELDAAEEAGFNTTQLVRPGTVPSAYHRHAKTYGDIELF